MREPGASDMLAKVASLPTRGRLILVVGAILLLGFLTTNVISFRVSTAALKTTILQNELPLTSSNIYAEIQTDLLRPIFVSSLMSNDIFLKDWLIEGEEDVAQMTRYLDEIRNKYSLFTSFLISEKTRNYHHFTGITKQIRTGEPNDEWFFRVRDMKEPYEVNIDFNAAQNNAVTIFINYRVTDYQGNFIGATGVGLQLDSVANIISHYRSNYQRGIYFVDKSGLITVRSDGAVITEENIRTAPGISKIADQILARNDGYFEYERDGETMLLTTRYIPDLGWRVIVEQRESEALRALWQSFVTNLAIGLGIILLTIGTIGYAINLYQKRLEDMAVTDKLTGIGNRQLVDVALAQALKLGKRAGTPTSIILMDIDHFKQVNDTYGHLKGDEAIHAVAQTLQRRVRDSDVLCRWGGEEFILLAHNCPLANALELAETLRAGVAEAAILTPDIGVRVTVSAGVAEALPGEDAAGLIGRADRALYVAKDAGRNRVEPAAA